MKFPVIASAAVILAFTAGTSLAAPCNTGTTKGNSPEQQTSNDKSSSADHSTKNMAGGQQPSSAKTVGAMNNVGVNQGLATGQGTNTSASKGNEDPASKNLAGGQQPASPGTVGAMNNAGANQAVGKKGDDC